MNIWIIDHYSSEPKYGGISRQYDFAIELAKRGYNVVVFSSAYSHFTHSFITEKSHQINEVNRNVHFVYVKTVPYKKNNSLKRFINMLSFQPAVKKVFKGVADKYGPPDVVTGCSVHPLAWTIAYKISRKYHSRFLVEVRDLWPANQIYDEGKSKINPEVFIWGFLEKWAYKRADKIIYSMSRGDKYLVDTLGIPQSKIIWIGQPMDMKRFDENAKNYDKLPDEIKTFIGNSFLCVFAGYYMDYEGVNEMLEAAELLKNENLPIRFVFVGSGVEKEKMVKYASDHNLHNVYIGDRMSKDLVPALLRRSDICLVQLAVRGNPNSYQFDASKNKINEYMYSHSCIIYGTYVENQFVKTSGAGYTILPFDSKILAQTIKEVFFMAPEKRKEFGDKAKEYVIHNNAVEVLTDKYESLFK